MEEERCDAWGELLAGAGEACGVEGWEGLLGLQLIANGMAKAFGEAATKRDEHEGLSESVVEFNSFLEAMKASRDISFIVCYRVESDAVWRMAWSDALTPRQVFDEMVAFIRCGFLLEY
jgi:hypothetical protein